MTGCNVRTNSIDALVKSGAVDSNMTINDVTLFNELNTQYSNIARSKYGVANEGLLFSKESKNVPRLGAPVYNRENTRSVLKAVPNNEMFFELQTNYDAKTNQDDLNKDINEDGGDFYQITSREIEQANKKLDDYLLNFLKPFGVTSKEVDALKNRLGEDALGVADVLNKVITIAKDRKIDTVPEEAGHMIVMLMGEDHPEIKNLLNSIEKWSGYKAVYDEYFGKYYNDKQIQIEAVGKVLAKALVSRYKESEKDKSFFTQVRKAINSFFRMLASANPFYSNSYTYNLADKIANNVLLGNTDYIANLNILNPKLNYNKAVEENPFAKSIIDLFTQRFGFALTGSLAIAGQGEDVYRPESEPIHDIDFVVNDKSKMEEVVKLLNDLGAIPIHNGIKGDDYVTASYMIPKKGYTITPNNVTEWGYVKDVITRNEKGEIVEGDAQKLMTVDFFVYNVKTDKKVAQSNFLSWQNIFQGKLVLSSLKSSERLFARPKDQLDYVLSNPVNRDNQLAEFTYLQTEGVPASKANKATLDIIKTAAAKMGISIEELDQYAKDAKLDIEPDVVGLSHIQRTGNAVKAVIAIAEGKEDQALTEEYVHMARAIIEQTNPQLVTAMIAKIDRFKIYDAVYKEYSKNPKYQLSNGKPNIRKIKMEAVDKLITELLINENEGSTEFPELREEKNRSMIKEWWDTILDFIRGIYSKTNIDLFKSTAEIINSGNIEGTVQDIKEDALFYQLKNNTKVDEAYNRIISEANRLQGPVPETVDASGKVVKARHYIYDNIKEIFNTVSKKVKSKFPDRRSDTQKKIDDMKKEWGSSGHRFLERFIGKVLIDKNGYKVANPNKDEEIDTDIDPKLQEKIKGFAIQLVNSYPPGTRFLVEKMAVNTKTKDMLASTIDFIAIAPNKTGDDIFIDVFDWKFANINKSANDDIPGYKTGEWTAQMNEYEIMLINYGFKRSQLRYTRMIPFITGYTYAIPGDTKSPLILSTLEVGNPTDMNANDIFTLPVPSLNELTNNPEVDRLISALRAQWQKLNNLKVDSEKKHIKKAQLAQISIAIRNLQVRLNFAPITAIADTFFNNAKEVINGFEGINYENLSAEELNDKLGKLIEYKNSALKFVDIDQVFLSAYPRNTVSGESKIILEKLEHNAALAKGLLEKIDRLQTDYAIFLALKEGIANDVEEIRTKDGRFKAERIVKGLVKSFYEGTQVPAKIIKLGSKLILLSRNKVALGINKKLDEFEPILLALEREAASQGRSAFDLIGSVGDKKLNLIKKIDPQFFKDYKAAKESKDKQFLLDNIDLDKYKQLAEETIQKQIAEIEKTTYDVSDVNNNNNIRDIKIKNVRNSLDITKDKFDGYTDPTFDSLFRKSMLENKHLSAEYKQLTKNEAAFNAWKFFIDLNERAYKAGYLEEQGMSFFPLIEATILKKIEQSKSGLGDAGNFLKDLYTTTEDQSTELSKVDPETGELERRILRPLTRSKKPVEALSRDVAKVGSLWVKALYEFENTKGLENTLLTLAAVEENKGSIVTDGDKVVFDGSIPRVNYGRNENASIMNAIVDDYVYGQSEDAGSLGNVQIGNVVTKFNKDKELGEKRVTNVKKAIKNADVLVRALAVGWKPLIATANFFGNNFQAYINAGGNYNYDEYFANTAKVVSGGFSKEKKAILHLIIPLNEDVSAERLREITKKIGIGRWLSTWSFSDVMMVTNSFPEKRLQYANALSFIDNSMVKDGKIVNIREELAKEDRAIKYKMTEAERKQLESTFEERVEKMKENNSIEKNVKIEGDTISIEGVSDDALAEYRTTIIEYNRKINGQMSVDNKAAFTRDTIFQSFMMFKTWIPKEVILRTKDISKDTITGNWEYGRGRVFVKVLAQLGTRNIMKMRDIITGSEEGLRIMDELLRVKKEDYFKKYGEELTISDEEFYDMIRTELNNQVKELKLLVGIMLSVAAAGAMIPDDDDELDTASRNRYKYLMKGLHKIQDELSFYYNPVSMESITKGSLIPSLGLLSKTYKIFTSTAAEGYGYAIGDEKMMKAAHPLKYTFNIVPGVYQFINEVLPYVFPETAKDLGIRVSSESRMR